MQIPPEIYLNLFVPLIIFDATYFLNKAAFFDNIVEITTYAIVGTLMSAIITGVLFVVTPFNSDLS